MSKFHGTITRRQFMKGLGLVGAGLGAVASIPTFHDVDELASSESPSTKVYNKWWVKEREFEDITSPVDWNVFKAYDTKITPKYSSSAAVLKQLDERNAADVDNGIKNKIPGFTRRDYAVHSAIDIGIAGSSQITDPPWNGIPWADADFDLTQYPAWTDTPENNLQTVRAAAHFFGTAKVGAMELNEHMKRLFNAGVVVWEDIDQAFLANGIYHMPNKCKWVIVYETPQNHVGHRNILREDKNSPSGFGFLGQIGKMYVDEAYRNHPVADRSNYSFLKGLGYQALKPPALNVPFGLFAGLSEQGRPAYRLGPSFGLSTRYAEYIVTDFPVAPSKPIDAGMHEFCKTCATCAKVCPVGAITFDKDTSWEGQTVHNRTGFKGWYMNYPKCIDTGAPGDCGMCQGACPFDHPAESLIHPVIRGTVATTPVFNSFFASMERSFYIKPVTNDDYAAWWTRDLETWTGDTLFGVPAKHIV